MVLDIYVKIKTINTTIQNLHQQLKNMVGKILHTKYYLNVKTKYIHNIIDITRNTCALMAPRPW